MVYIFGRGGNCWLLLLVSVPPPCSHQYLLLPAPISTSSSLLPSVPPPPCSLVMERPMWWKGSRPYVRERLQTLCEGKAPDPMWGKGSRPYVRERLQTLCEGKAPDLVWGKSSRGRLQTTQSMIFLLHRHGWWQVAQCALRPPWQQHSHKVGRNWPKTNSNHMYTECVLPQFHIQTLQMLRNIES